MIIGIYSTYKQYSNAIIDLQYSIKNIVFEFISAKSYNIHNYVLENADLLILDVKTYTPDVKLIIKYFRQKNIPILLYSDNKILLEKEFQKRIVSVDSDDRMLLRAYRHLYEVCNGIITSDPQISDLKDFSILISDKKNLEKIFLYYKQKYGESCKRKTSINFAEKMKINNRKYRKEIFNLKLDKNVMKNYLINYNEQYKDYILKMNYKELLQAYKTVKKNRQPQIFKKFAYRLLKDKRPLKIYKMVLEICKNPDYPLDEVMFYIIKDIPSNSRIFKNKEILENFIKDFCKLSFEKNIDGEEIFVFKDFNKKTNLIWNNPDTYNIREFLKTTLRSKKYHEILYILLELCKSKKISREELYYEVYLLKSGFVTPDLIRYAILKYIKLNRICWNLIKKDEVEKIIPRTKNKIYDFLTCERICVYKPEHFFIRIKGYGKDIEWGKRISLLTDKAAAMIRNKEDCTNVLTDICFHTRQNALENPNADKINMHMSGMLRCTTPESFKQSLVTPYNSNSRYSVYAKRFSKFKDETKTLKSPYKDLELTKIKVNKQDELSGKMIHVSSAKTFYSIKYIKEIYDDIISYVGKKYSKKDFKNIIKQIAKLHWIIAHNVLWGRGSDSIANVFIKAMLKSLNIKIGPLKPNTSLDLEAFCTELSDYQKLYPTYYTNFEYI